MTAPAPLDDPAYTPAHPPVDGQVPDVVASATCKMSKVLIGALVRDPFAGDWLRVADVVRVRDGSGDIRLTLANGKQLTAEPNHPVEIRTADQGA
jgi:hypothetical protein